MSPSTKTAGRPACPWPSVEEVRTALERSETETKRLRRLLRLLLDRQDDEQSDPARHPQPLMA